MSENSPFAPGALVVGYLRDSGHEAQELSIHQQEKEVRKFALEHGLTLVRLYRDTATASNTTRREQFHQMMSDLRGGLQVAGVLIWKFSRFARNLDDAQFYKADLRRRGYEIHSLKDNIPSGPEGRFFEAAIDWMNQRHLEDMSVEIQRALQTLVLEHGAVPGTPPVGFKRVPLTISHHRDGKPRVVHRWEPDPDFTLRIQQAFALLLSGASYRQILKQTRLFKAPSSLQYFFCNPIYKGELHYKGLILEHYCEPLIDPESWEAAGQVIAARREQQHLPGGGQGHPRRQGAPVAFLLSGIISCARCGSLLNINQAKTWQAYVCPNRKKHGTCDLKAIPRDLVETAALKTIHEYVLDPEVIAALQRATARQRLVAARQLETEIQSRQSELQAAQHKLTNLTEAIAEHGHSAALLATLGQVESQVGQIQEELAEFQTRLSAQLPDLTQEQIEQAASQLKARLSGEPEAVRNALQGLVHKIIVDRDGNRLYGQVLYYHPALPPSGRNWAISQNPAGALPYSPIFATPFEGPVRAKRKKPLAD